MKILPNFFIKNLIMKPIVQGEYGSMSWIENRDQGKIKAFWGSLEEWEKIKTWDDLKLKDDLSKPIRLDYGYDEGKDEDRLDIIDIKKAAEFRGGKCISPSMERGDMDTKLEWECAFSHRFKASPRLVLKAGHWCEKCEAPPWNHQEVARKNPFFAQVFRGENIK